MSEAAAKIEIEELRSADEDGGDLLGYYCRGHVDRYAFAQAANATSGAHSSYDQRYVRLDDVQHVWWRTVPMAGDPGCFQYIAAEPGARGAWQATVADVVQRRSLRRAQNEINEGARRAAIGFRMGVDWAIRALEYRHPEAARLLEEAFKNGAVDRQEKEAAKL